jgi:hypothetical protein
MRRSKVCGERSYRTLTNGREELGTELPRVAHAPLAVSSIPARRGCRIRSSKKLALAFHKS